MGATKFPLEDADNVVGDNVGGDNVGGVSSLKNANARFDGNARSFGNASDRTRSQCAYNF